MIILPNRQKLINYMPRLSVTKISGFIEFNLRQQYDLFIIKMYAISAKHAQKIK